jgi:hypothetical protein
MTDHRIISRLRLEYEARIDGGYEERLAAV